MDEVEDVDMATSTTLPAQNYERQDDAMQDAGDDTASQSIEEGDHASLGNDGAGREDEISGDAMDTTPDPSPHPEPHAESQPLQQPNSPHLHTTLDTTPATPNIDGASGDASSQPSSPHAILPSNADNDQIEIEEPQTSSNPATDTMPPPPQHDQTDDSPSEDSDDDVLQWQPIMEDASVPDADELKEIEATKEHSATDGKFAVTTITSSLCWCKCMKSKIMLLKVALRTSRRSWSLYFCRIHRRARRIAHPDFC